MLVYGTDDFDRSTEAFLVSASRHCVQKRLRPAFSPCAGLLSPAGLQQELRASPSLTIYAPSPLCFEPSKIGAGILTCHPSPTPFGLGLGSDLPWADLPAPGNLRFSANEILTRFIATRSGSITSTQSRRRHRRPSSRCGTLPYRAPIAARRMHP